MLHVQHVDEQGVDIQCSHSTSSCIYITTMASVGCSKDFSTSAPATTHLFSFFTSAFQLINHSFAQIPLNHHHEVHSFHPIGCHRPRCRGRCGICIPTLGPRAEGRPRWSSSCCSTGWWVHLTPFHHASSGDFQLTKLHLGRRTLHQLPSIRCCHNLPGPHRVIRIGTSLGHSRCLRH